MLHEVCISSVILYWLCRTFFLFHAAIYPDHKLHDINIKCFTIFFIPRCFTNRNRPLGQSYFNP